MLNTRIEKNTITVVGSHYVYVKVKNKSHKHEEEEGAGWGRRRDGSPEKARGRRRCGDYWWLPTAQYSYSSVLTIYGIQSEAEITSTFRNFEFTGD